ncbi:hypothetical protein ACIPZF_01585 [Pseudomonas sp. NPDC089752]|uniref:hypothetical protein n=1 Tax=Pseudomonas sp. NPDC089752 TaxID=3364472 RepID=UPI00381BB4C0
MKSFDHFRKFSGNPKLEEFFVDAVELEKFLPDLPLAGDSTLDKLMMLADYDHSAYVVSLIRWNVTGGLVRKREASAEGGRSKGKALIEVWVEEPALSMDIYGNSVVEPLHLVLTHTDEKLEFDERLATELGRLLEGFGYEFENWWSLWRSRR